MTVNQNVPYFISPILEYPKIRHGFFGRQGGGSSGDCRSLTGIIKRGASKQEVSENRLRILNTLFPKRPPLITADQVHGTDALVISKNNLWNLGEAPPADAMVTNQPEIVLGVATADCVPLLFYDPIAQVIGVAHAGWRGAFGGIVENTIVAMESLGSQMANILVAIGPCIHQDTYEVDPGFYNTFMEKDFQSGAFFVPHKDRYLFDLPGYVKSRLARAGIQQVDQVPFNTYAHEDIFFSCRRSYHQGTNLFGCQLSVIGLI